MTSWKECDTEACKGTYKCSSRYNLIIHKSYEHIDFISNECLAENGDPCIFPFIYKDQTFEECTLFDANANKPWCAVAVNDDSEMTSWKNCLMTSCKGMYVINLRFNNSF